MRSASMPDPGRNDRNDTRRNRRQTPTSKATASADHRNQSQATATEFDDLVHTSRRMAPFDMGIDETTVVEAAQKVAAVFADEAAESEKLRRPSDVAINALVESGVLQLMMPKVYGGMEADLDTYFEVALALGSGDTSLGWVANFYLERQWWFCQFPRSFQEELFAESTAILAPAMIAPGGGAEQVDGGWKLSGR